MNTTSHPPALHRQLSPDGALTPPINPLLRLRDAAKTLNISERTLWELTRRGEIRAVRLGRSVRYDPADLLALINTKKS